PSSITIAFVTRSSSSSSRTCWRAAVRSFIRQLSVVVLLVCIGPALAQRDKPPANRLPVPDEAAVEQAEKLVREVYKDDFAKKKAAEQIEFARKLLKAADETLDNPAAKFVLYREASHVAVRAGDVGVALEAAGALAQSFAVKPPEVQLGVLEAAEKARAA